MFLVVIATAVPKENHKNNRLTNAIAEDLIMYAHYSQHFLNNYNLPHTTLAFYVPDNKANNII